MKIWPVQDATARFSELLKTCLREGPQVVTKRGAEAAVLVPVDDWRRLRQSARPTLKEMLLADEPRIEFQLPARGRRRRRKIAPKDSPKKSVSYCSAYRFKCCCPVRIAAA